MNKKMNLNPTIEAIRNSAIVLRRYAQELDNIAIMMDKDEDISLAGEALNAISNCFSNLRIDLLATRPIRELQGKTEKESIIEENKK